MKFLRLSALLVTFSSFSFAVNKDMLAMQRDLEDKINSLQADVSSKLATMNGMLTAIQSDTRRNAELLAAMQDTVSAGVTKSLTPVNGLTGKVDSVGDDVRSLKDALADLSARMERMDAKITDLKNQMQIIQSPPTAPSAMGSGGGPVPPTQLSAPQSSLLPQGTASPSSLNPSGTSAAPPRGMSAERSYTDAMRDMQTGKADLAYSEFQQYLTYFPNTELAAKAQYYLGEIDYNRGKYADAVKNFDIVLERYPENPKTADAHLMKAYSLMRANERNNAVQEFRVLVAKYPHTDDARKALQTLRQLGLSSATTAQR